MKGELRRKVLKKMSLSDDEKTQMAKQMMERKKNLSPEAFAEYKARMQEHMKDLVEQSTEEDEDFRKKLKNKK